MADPTTTFKIQALVKGVEGVEKLKNSVRQLSSTASPASKDIFKLRAAAIELSRSNKATTRDLQTSVSVLRDLRSNVALTGNAYKQLSADLKIAEQRLEGVNRAGRKGIGTGGKAAVGAFAGAAASQILPGATTSMAALGGVVGGTPGAAIGAVIGGTIDLAGQAKESAKYAASVKRLEIALRGVTKTSSEYAKAQKVIAIVSEELNVPIDVATKQFTTLSASVIGAGGSVGEAEQVFRGVSEAIKATGGDAYDIQQAIRAMSQIFGKGKVSAEELQGQLGERLPGAVVKFAKATNRTLPQLQKDLRDGTVGLNDVMKFVVELSDQHRKAALEMAGSTEEAGERMDKSLKDLRVNFGNFFKPVGAGIQNIITDLARMANATFETARLMETAGLAGGFNKDRQQIVNRAHQMTKAIMETRGSRDSREYNKVLDETINLLLQERLETLGKTKEQIDAIVNSQEKWNLTGGSEAKTALDGAKEAIKDYLDKVNDMAGMTKDLIGNIFQGMEDQLVNFITKGTFEFRKFAQSIIQEMTRIFVRRMIMKPFTGWFEGLFSAKGNVLEGGKHLTEYAKGGVIDKPHYKFMANGGIAVAGEAGAEAILPLTRRNGKLGVEGGGGSVVNVSVDASGNSQVTGNEGQARMLGEAVAAAVRTQIANERRPGGLLYA